MDKLVFEADDAWLVSENAYTAASRDRFVSLDDYQRGIAHTVGRCFTRYSPECCEQEGRRLNLRVNRGGNVVWWR